MVTEVAMIINRIEDLENGVGPALRTSAPKVDKVGSTTSYPLWLR